MQDRINNQKANRPHAGNQTNGSANKKFATEAPTITLPKGGGAIKNIDEKFSVNAVNGTASVSVPLPFSSARGYAPSLGFGYSSGAGNGPFGLGWRMGVPSIKRKTDKALPRYIDANDSDIFLISDAEDLVPEYKKDNAGHFMKKPDGTYFINEFSSDDDLFLIRRYRPRTEGLFARIERWQEKSTGLMHWRVTSKDNVTTFYGQTNVSRLTDPQRPLNTFEWFIDFTYDDKGNCAAYEYQTEDTLGMQASQLHNRNRANGLAPFTNLYLKRVRYGNVSMYNQGDPIPGNFMFETLFDYGGRGDTIPFDGTGDWDFRPDAFSDYRAGFEIRTCRLCKRVLLYHHFPELPGGRALVKAVHLTYDNNGEDGFTFLRSAVSTGYTKHDDGSYTERSLPPLSFEYSKHAWDYTVHTVSAKDLEQAPVGLNEPLYQFTDLYSEGLSGILTEQADGWFYKQNWGNGRFTEAKKVLSKPAWPGLATGSLQLTDLEGNGLKQLVSWNDATPGFFELNKEEQWQPFQAFEQVPNLNHKDPNAKLIDLDGDGQADLLITEDNVFSWFPSLGKEGYGEAQKVIKSYDEEKGPAVIFSESTQTVFLAGMSGSGLTDIVRIRNGEVCYWPNLGFGRFGAKVSMDNAPVFDHPDAFDPSLIKLSDIDGSGTTDIIYIGKQVITIWFNRQGNSFADTPRIITDIPEINQQTKITLCDWLATGLSCLVWSSPLPQHREMPVRYIDLLNSQKPHILIGYTNNLGKEVQLSYKPSTHYYIEDMLAGTPWVTKLHFPVHCVAKVVTWDRILKTRFASEYSYHHGYYDHFEKEFRGFGRVDQTDAEEVAHFIKESNGAANNITDAALHQPPVLTKTWYHTGAFLDREKILDQFSHEYFQNTVVPEKHLPEPSMPADLTIEEWRQALRVCKGTLLRKEIYALDEPELQNIPYSAEQHNLLIEILQPAGQQPYAVLLTHESESISYHYERNPADARVTQTFVLAVNQYGQVLKNASLVYKRNPAPFGAPANAPEQDTVHLTCDEMTYTNDVLQAPDYRLPVAWQQKSYEVKGYPDFSGYLSIDTVRTHCNNAVAIDYEAPFDGTLQKRLLEFTREQFRDDDGVTPLAFGDLKAKALKHQSYKAAFNAAILSGIFSAKISPGELDTLLTDVTKGGYRFTDGYYWISSGIPQYDPLHFFLTTAVTDLFGNTTTVEFDATYSLFVKRSIDALNNRTQVKEIEPGKLAFNYRTLSPYIMQDINGNETAVRFDELGMTVASFIIGKKGIDQGDEIDETKTELKDAVDQPTMTIEYNLQSWYNQVQSPGFDLNNYKPQPTYTKTRNRETHYYADPAHVTKWHESYSWSDGGGHEILKKSQGEPGVALAVQPDGTVITVDTSALAPAQLRWIGNGRTILNNKGNPVKKYEPYFSIAPTFDDEKEMVELGVTPVMEYDPLDRLIKTTNPDKTFSTVAFTPWHVSAFDENDTVMASGWYADRNHPNPLDPEPADSEERAAWLSAQHDNTPEVKHLDSLGRTFLTIADNKTESLTSRTILDIEGNERAVLDALDRPAFSYEYDMLGNKLKQISIDAGSRWMVGNAAGKPLRAWDDRQHCFVYEFDVLQRPLTSSVLTGGADPVQYEKIVYGETLPAVIGIAGNQRGKVHQQYDQSGVLTNEEYDFKGNTIHTSKAFAEVYDRELDWTNTAAVTLLPDVFESHTAFDAMNRPITIITPHTATMQPSEIYPEYNEANLINRIGVKIRGAASKTFFVEDINYDAKGQRVDIYYGNNTVTKYSYDKDTYRLQRLLTTRNAGATLLQDLQYVYDATGHIVEIKDEAQADVFFDGEWAQALNRYEYDAVYRLIKATGRKHAGQTDINHHRADGNYRNHPFVPSSIINPNDAAAFRNYRETYQYDKAGNMLQQKHISKDSGFTRTFTYNTGNNRLAETDTGGFNFKYIDLPNGIDYDAHGNMSVMEQVQQLVWDFKDELQQVDLQGGGQAWYVYSSDKHRVRKIIERPGGEVEERFYLGVFELYRKTNSSGTVAEQRECLHVMDNSNRVAIIDTPVIPPPAGNDTQLIRYQYSNHLGSAALELDDTAQRISYEEYFPYGTTSCYTVDAAREVPARRYRYTGKERDEESGLYYHGARYYAPWLCRWTAADPVGIKGGINLFVYAANNPLSYKDADGKEPHPAMDDGLLRPDPAGPSFPGLARFSISPFRPAADPMGDIRPNLNLRTVYAQTGAAPGPSSIVATVPSQFSPSGIFLGTGDTHAYIHVDPAFRGQDIATSIRMEHFRQFRQVTGSRPTGFELQIANVRTIQQLRTGMDFRDTQIGQHVVRAARADGLRITPGSLSVTPEIPTSAGPNRFASGSFSYQPIRARLEGMVDSVRQTGRSIAQSARRAGSAIRSSAPGVVAGGGGAGGATLAARALGLGRATGSVLIRSFVPGAAEAMDVSAAVGGPRMAARLAVQPLVTAGRTVASAAAAAPAAAVATAVVAGVAGGVVGNVVEQHVTEATGSRAAGVASGTLAGAATGALIGAAIGSVVPGLGTAAGAIIGGTAGAIGGFIGSYW